MKRLTFVLIFILQTDIYGDVICSNDSSFQLDNRFSFLEEANPTYGDSIYTGSCACVDFSQNIDMSGDTVTFTLRLLDNEPVSGFMFDVYTNVPELSYLSVAKSAKIQGLYNVEGNPTSDMSIIGNWLDNRVRIIIYSINAARTEGNGEEGDLLSISYTLPPGAVLPNNVEMGFGTAIIAGTSSPAPLGNDLNVLCDYPKIDDPTIIYFYEGPVWHVSNDGSDSTGIGSSFIPFATIQKGIDTASDGDTVLVATGTYIENINFNGKNIAVIGEDRETTIIDGYQNGPVVTFNQSYYSSTKLSGFTIKNGYNSDGGGIFIWEDANPTISDLIIKENTAQNGGGIYSRGGGYLNNILIIDNINQAFDAGTPKGSGIFFCCGNSRLIDKLTLINNTVWNNNNLTIKNSIIINEQISTPIFDGDLPNVIYSNLSETIEISGDGMGNINVDPLFCDPENGDYTLADNSPCVGTGEDGSNMGVFGIGCGPINIGNIVINEIMNNPYAVGDSDGEWFELFNDSDESANISGWIFTDSADDSLIIPNIPEIPPFGYFILGANADTLVNGGVHIDFEYDRNNFNLGNSDDEIFVYGFGALVDAVEYDGGTLFPDLNGKSMELSFPGDDNNVGSNWVASENLLHSGDYGTPGQQNSTIYPDIENVSIQPLQDYILLTYNDDEEFFYADTGYFELSVQNSGSGILIIDSINVQLTQNIQNAYSVSQLPFSIAPFSTDTIDFGLISEQFGMAEVELFLVTNDVNYDSSSIVFEVPIVAKDEVAYSIQSLGYWDYLDLGELTVGETIDTSITIISMGERSLEIDDIYIPFQDTSLIQIEYEEGGLEMLETMEIAISITPNEPGYYYFEWQSSGIWIKIESNADIWSPNGCSVPQVPCEPQVGITFSAASLSNDESTVLPYKFVLYQNYPNPFNPITSLRYDLPNDGLVNITIYDMMGRIVKKLVNGSQTAGFKSVQWNATNDRNEPVSAGLYLYTIQAGEFRQTKKMVLLK